MQDIAVLDVRGIRPYDLHSLAIICQTSSARVFIVAESYSHNLRAKLLCSCLLTKYTQQILLRSLKNFIYRLSTKYPTGESWALPEDAVGPKSVDTAALRLH